MSDEELKRSSRAQHRMAEIEDEKRAEADERAAARQEREQEEGVKQAAETVSSALCPAQRLHSERLRELRTRLGQGVGTLTDVAQRTSDQVFHVFDQTGERAQARARHSSDHLTLMAKAGNIMVRGLQDLLAGIPARHAGRLQQNSTPLRHSRAAGRFPT